MNAPTVSVCIPTYNYAQLIPRAVESVLAQTFEDFELLVYEDASTDNTVEVMQQYLDDPRVRLVVQETNQGLFANFNQSASKARGRYVKYLCADDWLDPHFLERTVPLMDAHPEVALLATAHWHVDYDGVLTAEQVGPFGDGPICPADVAAEQLALWGNIVGMPTNTLIRRDALESVGGFDASYAPGADVQLWLKLLALGDMAWVPEKLCFWRIHARHTHDYGPDPSESMFRVWEDAPAIENSAVPEDVARIGVDREALHVALYAAAHVLRGRIGRARALLAMSSKHVGLARTARLVAAAIPRMVGDQARRLLAIRRGRLVVYDPRPHGGPPLSEFAQP